MDFNLEVINNNGTLLVDSRQVAEMVGKRHDNLVRDIKGYAAHIDTSSELRALDFFIETTYTDTKGESRSGYMITKKGCNMVANKMTGNRGVLFTATYVTRFEEMEKALSIPKDYTTALLANIDILTGIAASQTKQLSDHATMFVHVDQRLAALESNQRIPRLRQPKVTALRTESDTYTRFHAKLVDQLADGTMYLKGYRGALNQGDSGYEGGMVDFDGTVYLKPTTVVAVQASAELAMSAARLYRDISDHIIHDKSGKPTQVLKPNGYTSTRFLVLARCLQSVIAC